MLLTKTNLKRAVTTSVAIAATATFLPAIAQQATTPLSGAGATFPLPLYQRYFAELRKENPPLQVSYQGIGSGGGIKQLIAGSVDFAGSDTAMTNEEVAKVKNGVFFVPTSGGPIAVVYNLPGVSNLKLSRKTLPRIFDGQITNWNDPAIAADNPGVKLPNQPIRLAVRADSSGTTFHFTNSLSGMDPYFRGRVGANKAPKWSGNPLKAKGNPGVAQIVKRTPGTIGYVESTFAEQNKLQTALVQNQKGQFVPPNVQQANQALDNVQFNPDFRVNFDNLAKSTDGYPIVGVTWIMTYKNYNNPAKAASVKRMVQWMMTEGQQLNGNIGYTRIPPKVASQVVQAANSTIK